MSALYTAVTLAVLASSYTAYSQYQQGRANKMLNDYNALQEEQNAQTAQRDAAIQANQVRRQNARVQAKQRAAFAANGVVGDTGSPLLEESEQAGYLEMGALETERQGNIEAGKHRQQAVLDKLAGRIALTAGQREAAGTVLSGASKAAGTYAGI